MDTMKGQSKAKTHASACGPSCPERGVALVFVLWLMVLLSAVALEMAFRGHLRAQMTATTGESAKAFYLARAGVERAVADLAEGANDVQLEEMNRQDSDELYREVQLGEGTFTLYGGTNDTGDPRFGPMDEAAKLNLGAADATVLERVPGLTPELAGTIVSMRQAQPFRDPKDLLGVEGVDVLLLLGEDQNENGVLDANENDGDETWPPDNADGVLDAGLTAYLTTWSASRNVSSDGEDRVNLNKADAEAIREAASDLTEQQADSIVAKRENGEFSSVMDLLDVELVEKVAQDPSQQGGEGQAPPPEENASEEPKPESGQNGKEEASGDKDESDDGKGDKNESAGESKGEEGKEEADPSAEKEEEPKSEEKEKFTYKGTGQKAFDEETVKKIADRFTVKDEDVLQGLVNVNTASAEVLACLPGLDESLAQAIVLSRESRSGGFTTPMDLLDVSGMSMELLKPIYGLLTARSDVYTVRAIGVLGIGRARANVTAVLDRTEDDVRIRYWQEHD